MGFSELSSLASEFFLNFEVTLFYIIFLDESCLALGDWDSLSRRGSGHGQAIIPLQTCTNHFLCRIIQDAVYGEGNEGVPAPKATARKRKADEPADEEIDFKVSIA